jgi:hypothetical protein
LQAFAFGLVLSFETTKQMLEMPRTSAAFFGESSFAMYAYRSSGSCSVGVHEEHFTRLVADLLAPQSLHHVGDWRHLAPRDLLVAEGQVFRSVVASWIFS